MENKSRNGKLRTRLLWVHQGHGGAWQVTGGALGGVTANGKRRELPKYQQLLFRLPKKRL